jgi:cytochrome P450
LCSFKEEVVMTSETTDTGCPVQARPNREYEELLSLVGHVDPSEDIVWNDERKVWITGSYRAFREVSQRPEIFAFPGTVPEFAPEWFDSEFYIWFEGGPRKMAFLHSDEHDRVHRWWVMQFKSSVVEQWREEVIRPVVNDAIDAFAHEGRAELMSQLALPIPLPIILKMMGLPTDRALMERYNAIAHGVGAMRWQLTTNPDPDGSLREEARVISQEMRDVLMPYLEERRGGTGDDLISRLWRDLPGLIEGGDEDDAMFANLTTLFEAGIGTTAGSIGDVMHHLAREPGYQDLLREDESKIPPFVEEAVRLASPGHYIARQVLADTELFGAHLRRGDMLFGMILTANRDPDRFPDPHRTDLGRRAPRGHLGFSSGPRHCAGHSVGRTELQEVVRAVVNRLNDLRLDPGKAPPERGGAGARRPWRTLDVTFTPEQSGFRKDGTSETGAATTPP